MKILIILLFLLVIFWYYRKRKLSLRLEKEREKAIRVEMKACEHCGVFFLEGEGYKIKKEDKEKLFCSEKCLKEFLSKERV